MPAASELMKIDTHSHTAGVSFCSQIQGTLYGKIYRNKGIRTVVLTNHYSKQQMGMYAYSFKEQIYRFMDEYRFVKEQAKIAGVTVLLGAEVAIASETSPYNEFLLFGATEEFLLAAPPLYDLDQAALYRLCNDNGILMYQAHPFRHEHNHSAQDPEFMDGVEINCHPLFQNYCDEVCRFADKHDLGISCGSDLHYHTQAGFGGMFVDSSVKTEKDLARYLKTHKRPKIFVSPKLKIKL